MGNNTVAQNHILQALHDSGIGGHSRVAATYSRIKALFAWPQLKQSVHSFVQKCDICQRAKVEHTKLPGLLHLYQCQVWTLWRGFQTQTDTMQSWWS